METVYHPHIQARQVFNLTIHRIELSQKFEPAIRYQLHHLQLVRKCTGKLHANFAVTSFFAEAG